MEIKNLQQQEQQEQQQTLDVVYPNGTATLSTIDNQNLPVLPPAKESDFEYQLRHRSEQVSQFFTNLPDNLGRFFNRYQQSFTVLGLIFAAIVGLKVLFAVLGAINDILLVKPIFELIGIGYAVWFVSRFLIKSSTRQELGAEIRLIKKQIFGGNISEPLG
jgi:CAAD domains of cyanobacterial aminoacyl-tRNA synthetase